MLPHHCSRLPHLAFGIELRQGHERTGSGTPPQNWAPCSTDRSAERSSLWHVNPHVQLLSTPQTSFILLAIRVICLLRLYWSPSRVTYSCRKKLQGSRNHPVRGRLLQPRHICGNVRRSLLEWTTRVDDEGDVTGLKSRTTSRHRPSRRVKSTRATSGVNRASHSDASLPQGKGPATEYPPASSASARSSPTGDCPQ